MLAHMPATELDEWAAFYQIEAEQKTGKKAPQVWRPGM